MADPISVVVLLSGGGTTLENLCQAIDRGELPARITRVVSSREDAFGLERARRRGIPAAVVPSRAFRSPVPGAATDWKAFSEALNPEVDTGRPDLVCLAGFMCLWNLPGRYRGRAMNIHPSLLPAFGGQGMYGHRVHEAVLAAGASVSGCTVHWVDGRYDTGAVILQRSCPVLPGDTVDTLAARVAAEECLAYPEAVRRFAAAGRTP